MSFDLLDAAVMVSPVELPADFVEAALMLPPVLVRGASPRPVTILVEIEANAG